MQLDTTIVETMLAIDFLSHKERLSLACIDIKDLKEADKLINSLKWENKVLDKTGDLTAFLFKNEPETYQLWNALAEDARERVIAPITKRLDKLVAEGLLLKTMLPQIQFDLVYITIYKMIKSLKSHVTCQFLEDLYHIYQSGHIPCSYSGVGILGKYKVY